MPLILKISQVKAKATEVIGEKGLRVLLPRISIHCRILKITIDNSPLSSLPVRSNILIRWPLKAQILTSPLKKFLHGKAYYQITKLNRWALKGANKICHTECKIQSIMAIISHRLTTHVPQGLIQDLDIRHTFNHYSTIPIQACHNQL